MPLQPPATLWQIILQILGLVVRLPFIILAMVATVSIGYLGIVAIIKFVIWFDKCYLSKPW
jgi:hypothetical protein